MALALAIIPPTRRLAHRRRGLGTRLLDRLLRPNRHYRYWPETREAAKFYREFWRTRQAGTDEKKIAAKAPDS